MVNELLNLANKILEAQLLFNFREATNYFLAIFGI